MLLQQIINKILQIITVAGISLCLLYLFYMVYVAAFERVAAELESSGAKTILMAAGFVAVAEGDIVRVGDGCTIVRYYQKWIGTYEKRIIYHENADYPENTKVPVVYSIGSAMGSCLVIGFYRKYMQLFGIIGLVMSGLGFLINLIGKGIRTWQGERL